MSSRKKAIKSTQYQKLVQDLASLNSEAKQRAVLLYSLKQLDTKRRMIFKFLYTSGLSMQAASRVSMKKTIDNIINKHIVETASQNMLRLLQGETLGFDITRM